MKIQGPWTFIQKLRWVLFVVGLCNYWTTVPTWNEYLMRCALMHGCIIVLPTCTLAVLRCGRIWLHDYTASNLTALAAVNSTYVVFVFMDNYFILLTVIALVVNTGCNSGIADDWLVWYDGPLPGTWI